MSKTNVFSLLLLLLILLPSSCSRKEEALYSPGMGGVMIDLTTDLPATKSGVTEETLSADDFKVEVINPDGVIFKRWNTFAEYKAEQEETGFQMNAGGPYRLRAMYGDSTAYGFDAVYFIGEQEFTVLPQETTEVQVICRMGNVKVAVRYGDNIRKNYSDFKATVYNEGGSLVFGKDCTEPGYLPAGELSVYIELTDHDGKKWYFQNGSTISAAAGDFVTLKVDTEYIPEMNVSLTVNVDSSTERHDIGVTLPSLMLPVDAPVMTLEGFDETAAVHPVENMPAEKALVKVVSPAGLYGCTLKVESSQLDWPEMDLFNLTAEQQELLTEAGVTVPRMYRAKEAQLDLSALGKLFRYSDGEDNIHKLTIKFIDAVNKVVDTTLQIVPKMAHKSVSAIEPGDIWAARAYIDLTTDDGNPDLLYPEIQTAGSDEWIRPEFTVSSVSGNTKSVTITGLNPNSTYKVRAGYNDFQSEPSPEFTTEAAQQVENAGFEEWSEWEYYVNKEGLFGGDDVNQTNYAPYKDEDSRWWDSNNSETTPGDRTNTGASYKSFPMVSYVDGHESDRAAQLMLIAISNAATSGTAPFPTVRFGKIFTGVYNGDQGRQFTSRPTKLCFWHKFSSYDSDVYKVNIYLKNGETLIGESSYTSSTSESEWKEVTLEIIYSRMDLKADNIYIEFVCGSDTGKWQYGKDITYGGNKTANVHGGSILTIDDIELIYE